MAFDPMVIVFARMIISSILFLIAMTKWLPKRFYKKDLGLLLFMAMCEPCLYFLLEGYALTLTTASQAGMVSATLPILVAFFSFIFFRERLRARSWLGLILAVGGVIWVSLSGKSTESAPYPALGNLLEMLAMTCAAGYTLSIKKLSASYSPWFLTAVQSFAGTIFFFPLLYLPTTTLPDTYPLGASMAVLYLGACISIGAYGFYNYGLSRLPAWQASAFINLIPVFSLLFGWWFLNEVLGYGQMAGAALVFVGVIIGQDWIAHFKEHKHQEPLE